MSRVEWVLLLVVLSQVLILVSQFAMYGVDAWHSLVVWGNVVGFIAYTYLLIWFRKHGPPEGDGQRNQEGE